ncbi:MAG: hypothetical protein JNG84_13400, partial [Archangium sp.]|nr:hypothetical protein [Archangium sp.]
MSLIAAAAWAEPPQFSAGGFRLGFQYGPGIWNIDTAKLRSQLPLNPNGDLATIFSNEVQNTHTLSLGVAYDILGHASLGVDLTATGWNLPDANRGGAGFLVGRVAWHPLEIVWIKKKKRPVPLDISGFFGVGYGIVGQRTGIDGLVLEAGFQADYFFTRFFGLGFFVRGVFLNG